MIKFAVIEYSSKSGRIWKHSQERPNYLADPLKEIDPTSFGCYVSALRGEHIPLTALIKPNWQKKIIKRLTSSWPQEYDISYLQPFDVLLLVHQISDGHEITRLAKKIKQAYPHVRLLGVATQPFGILQEYWRQHREWLADFKQFMDSCDIFVTIVAGTRQAWQNMTMTRVEYLPQPYPAEYAARFWQPRTAKKPILFVAGVTDRDNIKKGQVVARAIWQRLPDYTIHITKTSDTPLDIKSLGGAPYEIIPFMPWREHLAALAHTALVINTDYTQTRGRVQADCAAVGTPSIGADSDGQVDLFPGLPANRNTSIAELVEQGVRLLTDEVWYERVAKGATEQLNQYNYERSAARLNNLVRSLN